MAAPAASDVRAFLEGYGITAGVLTNAWIDNCITKDVIPEVEKITRQVFTSSETETTEYYSGNGSDVLILNRRPVNEIVSIININSWRNINFLESIELISAQGIIKAKSNYVEVTGLPIFQKGTRNFKITYKYGFADYPDIIFMAIVKLASAKVLNLIGARTGGGALTVQAFGRNYGSHGKYTDIRKELVVSAYGVLKYYATGVVGA